MSDTRKSISYSQIMMYHTCPHQWYLKYVKNLSKFEQNIYTLFGTAVHTTLQTYLSKLYESTESEANKNDTNKMLMDELKKEFKKSIENNPEYPATLEELNEFYSDGIKVIDWFKKHRSDYFKKKGIELVGCEIPLEVDLRNNLKFFGLIDIVLKDTIKNRILIKDFKTSTRGWSQYQKSDKTKTQQMILYKKMYAEKFNVNIDSIDIEYIILKRKISENSDYPQKRIQRFVPPSGKPTVNNVMRKVDEFINECFDSEGNYIEKKYKKNPNQSNCRFCEFKDKPELCNQKNEEII